MGRPAAVGPWHGREREGQTPPLSTLPAEHYGVTKARWHVRWSLLNRLPRRKRLINIWDATSPSRRPSATSWPCRRRRSAFVCPAKKRAATRKSAKRRRAAKGQRKNRLEK